MLDIWPGRVLGIIIRQLFIIYLFIIQHYSRYSPNLAPNAWLTEFMADRVADLDATVSQLCNVVAAVLQQPFTQAKSVTLQRVTALLDTINSTFTMPVTLGGTFVASPVKHCVDFEGLLSCLPNLLLRLISGISLLHGHTFRSGFSRGVSLTCSTCYVLFACLCVCVRMCVCTYM